MQQENAGRYLYLEVGGKKSAVMAHQSLNYVHRPNVAKCYTNLIPLLLPQ